MTTYNQKTCERQVTTSISIPGCSSEFPQMHFPTNLFCWLQELLQTHQLADGAAKTLFPWLQSYKTTNPTHTLNPFKTTSFLLIQPSTNQISLNLMIIDICCMYLERKARISLRWAERVSSSLSLRLWTRLRTRESAINSFLVNQRAKNCKKQTKM